MAALSEILPLILGDPTVDRELSGSGSADDEEVSAQLTVPFDDLLLWIPDLETLYVGEGNREDLGFTDWSWRLRDGCADLDLRWRRSGAPPDAGEEMPEDFCCDEEAGSERPLYQHPDFTDPNPDWGGKSMKDFWVVRDSTIWHDGLTDIPMPNPPDGPPEDIRGATHYLDGSYVRKCTEYYRGTPPCLDGIVGTLQIPPGDCLIVGGGLDGDDIDPERHWLVSSGYRCPPGANGQRFGVRRICYVYSVHGWPSWYTTTSYTPPPPP